MQLTLDSGEEKRKVGWLLAPSKTYKNPFWWSNVSYKENKFWKRTQRSEKAFRATPFRSFYGKRTSIAALSWDQKYSYQSQPMRKLCGCFMKILDTWMWLRPANSSASGSVVLLFAVSCIWSYALVMDSSLLFQYLFIVWLYRFT